ncbi:MAG: beta-ketoacyl-ACP synthase II [Myxococcales bacterium]|nr:beta-ketoacyl-ACP synthase II [Myxococcales bacterium]
MMERVVITGIGLVTPLGPTAESTWEALLQAKTVAAPITAFDASAFATKFACEVRGWDATPWFSSRDLKHVDRVAQFGVAAAMMALADAGLTLPLAEAEADRWATYIGSGMGGIITIEHTMATYAAKGPRYGISPYFVTDIISNIIPGMVSLRGNLRGANMSHVSACATGGHAIGEAMRAIRHGYVDGAVAGGAEATISPLGIGGFSSLRAMSTRNDEPATACRPFDRDRDGFVMGEGGAVVVLEGLTKAKRRGARILAEVVGYGASADAHHITAPSPDGQGAARAMRMALADAKWSPDRIDYVNAHGTSTPLNDAAETAAMHHVFGAHARRLSVSSTKSMTGHMLGAAGAAEAAFCALALARGVVPPTANYATPDPACDLDYVPNEPRQVQVRGAMTNAIGFGGTNAVLALAKWEE